MERLRAIGRRALGVLVTVWLVFTLTFAYVVATPFARQGLTGEGAPTSPTAPLWNQYLDWLAWMVTIWDQPVFGVILDHLSYTAVYFVPAVVFAIVVGTALRAYTIAREGNRADVAVSAVTIVGVSIPVFLLALFLRESFLVDYMRLFDTVRIYHRAEGALSPLNLRAALWPMVPMGVYLLAVQSRYTGDLLGEYASAEFVKTARMKGGGTWSVARHMFRNNAIPLLTLFFTDMLGMVVVGIVAVEYVVGAPGIGELTIDAVVARDVRLVLSLSVLTVAVGVVANFVQDVAYLLADPRVAFDE